MGNTDFGLSKIFFTFWWVQSPALAVFISWGVESSEQQYPDWRVSISVTRTITYWTAGAGPGGDVNLVCVFYWQQWPSDRALHSSEDQLSPHKIRQGAPCQVPVSTQPPCPDPGTLDIYTIYTIYAIYTIYSRCLGGCPATPSVWRSSARATAEAGRCSVSR